MNKTELTLEERLLLRVDAAGSMVGLQSREETQIVSQSPFFTFVEGKLTECKSSVASLTEVGKGRVREILQDTQLERDIMEFLGTGTHNIATITNQIGGPYFESHIAQVLGRLMSEDTVQYLNFGGGFYTIKKTT